MIFEGDRTRQTSLRTIEGVVQSEDVLWVQRRSAHDWLVQCATESDATTLADALRQSAGVA